MKRYLILILLLLFSSCTQPAGSTSLDHMKKSEAIETIVDSINDLNYDESYSELDRDRLRLKYAKDFYYEVSALTRMLRKQSHKLPNHKPIKEDQQKKYLNVIKLLEENLNYLDEIIQKQRGSSVLKAIKSTKQSCLLCHSEFQTAL